MKIRLEHKNIGAALMQIAEHDQFTAINSMKVNGEKINNAFKINHNIGIFCKYASEPNSLGEYLFTFTSDHIKDIREIATQSEKTFIVLACIEDGEICNLEYSNFEKLIENRRKFAGTNEDSYQILVTAELGKSLKAYVNAAGKKGTIAGKGITIARKSFPDQLFE
ncbi:hypothetical protein [Chromobacterium phragmitis]|uniref:Uncharacterized protein n=1 Tax=Chromobacterium phragmitis TaxID=2202141 RepID=A0ABV0IR70_9NEIS